MVGVADQISLAWIAYSILIHNGIFLNIQVLHFIENTTIYIYLKTFIISNSVIYFA